MSILADPAKLILASLKPAITEKDKTDNLKVLTDATAERLKVWARPTLENRVISRKERIKDALGDHYDSDIRKPENP